MTISIAYLAAVSLAAAPAARIHRAFEATWADRLVPLVSEVVRFPTVAGDAAAFAAQRAWLHGAAPALGLAVRDTPRVIEVELAGPPGAPVLGLIVHGDVQPVAAREWTVPPFDGVVRDGRIWGRGTIDDKGALVQALLAMAALRSSGVARTHTVRLLVGTSEETDPGDVLDYLAEHAPPDLSLVLDSDFPVVVGEKAWNELVVTAPRSGAKRVADTPFEVTAVEAGVATPIVPDLATLALRWTRGAPGWEPFLARVRERPMPEGTRLEVQGEGAERVLVVHGRSAHAGVALRSGRNALVALAGAVDGLLPPSDVSDLLQFAKLAGRDLDGGGLGLPRAPPPWDGFETNVATVKPGPDGLALAINVRAGPLLHGDALKAHLEAQVREFDERTGAALSASGRFASAPLVFDPESRVVKRLLAAYARATGRRAAPVVSAGGTYAKRFPRAIPFGPWFRDDGPYPGHAADEFVPIASLRAGTRVLIEALADLACGPKLERPFDR